MVISFWGGKNLVNFLQHFSRLVSLKTKIKRYQYHTIYLVSYLSLLAEQMLLSSTLLKYLTQILIIMASKIDNSA